MTTNLTRDERERRLRQVRERSESRKRVAGKFKWAQVSTQEWSDIDFLLSLLDGQAAGGNECELCDRPSGESCVCLDCYNLQASAWEESQKQLASAATRMREACIETIKARCGYVPFEELVHELESLTLDQVEQETKK